jgi:4-diphosphocytidyl-2-C-methyl-D-erythritol kinase
MFTNMIAFSNAKINIGLNITSRRSDGYHNLETIFYPVKIYDAIEVVESDKFVFTSSGLAIPGMLEENLCIKAYQMIASDKKLPPVAIHLHKHIPIGAGLGGGSSNAAFFIRLLNAKFQLELSDDDQTAYARLLGADCAFFISNKPVFAFEKGDRFEKIELNLDEYFVVLITPPVHVSSGEAYRGVKPHPPMGDLRELLKLPIEEWKKLIKNDFEESIFNNHLSIRGIKSDLYDAGALYAAMSGSGSSVFGIFRSEVKLDALEKANQVFYGI